MSNSNQVTNWYGDVFKAWPAKLVGNKPTAEMLQAIHGLKARPGKQALACAMGLRPEGVTAAQIVIACGAPQLNKMRGFITDALLKRLPVAPTENGHTVYKLEVTAKGKQRIARTEAEAAKADAEGEGTAKAPAKAKGKAKAKKAAKAKVTETPADISVGVADGAQGLNEPEQHASA